MLTKDEKDLYGKVRMVLVHRFVMAMHLERRLLPGEVVMHKDGNKLNNDLSNLELGDSLTNTRQHWQALQAQEQWKRLAVLMLTIASFPISAGRF
jgi:hypothetical protein